MSKFHISSDGIPRKCNATKNPCPLGGEENHYNNMEDALEASNEQQTKEFGLLPGTPTHNLTRDNNLSLENQSAVWATQLEEHYADKDNRKEGFDYDEYFEESERMPDHIIKRSNEIMDSIIKDGPSKNASARHTNYKTITRDYLKEIETQEKFAKLDKILAKGDKIPEGSYEFNYESTEEEVRKYGNRKHLKEWKKDNKDRSESTKKFNEILAEQRKLKSNMAANAKFRKNYGSIDETNQHQMSRRGHAQNEAEDERKRENSSFGKLKSKFKLPDLKE